MKGARVILQLLGDGVLHLIPSAVLPRRSYAFAFLVHPRDQRDIERKVPLLKGAPPSIIRLFEHWFWPGTLTHITGLKSRDTGDALPGYIISIPMTAATMLENRAAALKQIRRALILARKKGARIAGLGALTASLTRGGEDLIDIPGIGITTGHAYTGYNVTQTAYAILESMQIPVSQVDIAIVGAAGSIGSIAAEICMSQDETPHSLTLIDIPRKEERVRASAERIQTLAPTVPITVSTTLEGLDRVHLIITATSAPEALIHRAHLTPGTIIVDDAQPSDVADDVLSDKDILVLSAGAVTTPQVYSHYPMGLHGKDTNYCCLAEVLALAAEGREKHYVIQRTDRAKVHEIAAAGKELNFTVAPFQNSTGFIPEGQILHVETLLKKRL